MSNYSTKSNLKSATGVDISAFVKEVDLANLKSDIEKSDVGKLEKYKWFKQFEKQSR